MAATLPDYRVLAPKQLIDINGYIRQVAVDTLGVVSGIGLMDKQGETVGDRLDEFEVDISEKSMDAFFANHTGSVAADLLKIATTRVIHDITRCYQSQCRYTRYSATIDRKAHAQNPEPPRGKFGQLLSATAMALKKTVQAKGPVSTCQPVIRTAGSGAGAPSTTTRVMPSKVSSRFSTIRMPSEQMRG